MIALDDQPFNITNNIGSLAEPRYSLPSDTFLRQTAIPELHHVIRDKLVSVIDSSGFMSFTTDTWTTSMSSDSLMSLTGHWIDDAWQRKSAILQTSHLPGSHTAQNIRQKFAEMLDNWSLIDKVCTSCLFPVNVSSAQPIRSILTAGIVFSRSVLNSCYSLSITWH